MYELSPEVRSTHVASAIADLLQRYPDLCWTDVQMINEGPGWDYELMWYEQHPPRGPAPARLIRGERLEDLALMRAWRIGRLQADRSMGRLGA